MFIVTIHIYFVILAKELSLLFFYIAVRSIILPQAAYMITSSFICFNWNSTPRCCHPLLAACAMSTYYIEQIQINK